MPSAVIAAYEYDAAAETLTVRYQTGKVYRYLGVPEKVFKAMRSTMYKGPFMNREIKGHYAYREIKSSLMIQDFLIADDGVFPGNKLPALLYKGVLDIPLLLPATHVKKIFEKNGWSNSWDAGIFTDHHYHSLTHEVLGIYSGRATVQLGDNSGPKILLEKGDVLVIPAGVAHKNMDEENAIGVVGAYPDGRDYDMNYGKPGERPQTDHNIAEVPLPVTDPLQGKDGELTRRWT